METLTKLFLYLYPVQTVTGGCLLPSSKPFLASQEVLESYFPEDTTVSSFEFDTCSGNNCFEYSPESKLIFSLP